MRKFFIKFIVLFSIVSFCLACAKKKDTLFTAVPSSHSGLNFENTVTNTKEFNIFKYRNFYNGGGVAVGDLNNDGLPDLYFTANMGSNKLYLNKGKLQFEDITDKAGVAVPKKWSTGVVMVDINNDGWLDIYVCNAGYQAGVSNENELYINNKDLTFTESAAAYGLNENGYATHAAFFDYDQDGDLDAYMLNNSFIPVNTLNYSNERDLRAKDWPVKDFLKGGGDKLLRNDRGKFVDVSAEAGIYGSLIGFGLGVNILDANDDGYQDIYVSNDFYEKDYLYINKGDGTFSEELEQRMDHISMSSMGADVGDINNDGLQEIFTTDMLPDDDYRLKTTSSYENNNLVRLKESKGFYHQYMQNSLHLNNGAGKYSEIANYAGVQASDWSWGALFFDADNDGFNDIFVCNGIYKDVTNQDFIDFFANDIIQKMVLTGQKEDVTKIIDKMPSVPIKNKFFYNNHDLTFKDAGDDFGFGEKTFSNGAAYADFDNDGDLDLLINNVNQKCLLYENSTHAKLGHHYLKIKLEGTKDNLGAIGAKIELFIQGSNINRSVVPSRGFQSSMDYVQTIGLGSNTTIDSVRITWPERTSFTIKHPPIDTLLQLRYAEDAAVMRAEKVVHTNLFEQTDFHLVKHEENLANDFNLERIAPYMLSYEGPKMCVGDVNADGLEDWYICGADGQAGQLYLQTKNGFVLSFQKDIEMTKLFEDTACAFFDADQDGDLDLYVGSGGNTEDPVNGDYLDRFYLNDGKGNFKLSMPSIPKKAMNTSVVLPMDYDLDGDLDLLVASRSVPQLYGLDAPIYLYQNDGKGKFREVLAKMNPELAKGGMVTDAKWSDIDHDLKNDLVLVGDWMAPQVYTFDGKKFIKKTSKLDELNGFWNTVTIDDLDSDGHPDLILGNLGTNFYLKADATHPLKLWINDFDQNKSYDNILTKTIEGHDKTVLLKKEMTEQLPSIKKITLKHNDFARQDLQDFFPFKLIKSSVVKTVNYLHSIIAWNDGHGNYIIQKLPAQAQFSNINSIAAYDVNHDGRKDLIVGGNSYAFQGMFGRLDANHGQVFMNNGNRSFNYLDCSKVGLSSSGMIKQIKIISFRQEQYLVELINNQVPLVFKFL